MTKSFASLSSKAAIAGSRCFSRSSMRVCLRSSSTFCSESNFSTSSVRFPSDIALIIDHSIARRCIALRRDPLSIHSVRNTECPTMRTRTSRKASCQPLRWPMSGRDSSPHSSSARVSSANAPKDGWRGSTKVSFRCRIGGFSEPR